VKNDVWTTNVKTPSQDEFQQKVKEGFKKSLSKGK
jgi:hypothetical protein